MRWAASSRQCASLGTLVAMPADGLRLGRRFFLADLLLLGVEVATIGYPIWDCYTLDEGARRLLWRTAPIVVCACALVWRLAFELWRAPLMRAARRRLAGEVLDAESRARAFAVVSSLPRR